MGCDIHGVFQAQNKDGDWEDVVNNYEEDRDYELFAWLADVRNDDIVLSISEPRGLPKDFIVTDGFRHPIACSAHRSVSHARFSHRYDTNPEDGDCLFAWMGDHSHSWLTAEEILNDPAQNVAGEGILALSDYQKWDKVSEPSGYQEYVGGVGVQINHEDEIGPSTTHVRVAWHKDLDAEFLYFTDEVRRLCSLHGKVRFVFGFDS